MSKDKGGPAFARSAAWSPGGTSVSNSQEGMDLRDYFAAKAMQSILLANISADPNELEKHIGAAAYSYADAMLKAREAE